MALHFSDLFGKREQNINSVTGAARNAPVSDNGKIGYAEQIKYVKSGQTLNGEVIAKNGSEVQIRLDGDTVIHARLEKDMNVSVGQNMTFEVQTFGKTDGQTVIALRPLYENLTQDANTVKALTAAGIPVNNETAAMVAGLMKEGMSIDVSSLQSLYKDMMSFPEAGLLNLVSLHKLEVPVTEENLRQIAGYRNLEYQILNSVETLAEETADTLLNLVDTSPVQAGRMLFDMLRIFGETPAILPDGAQTEAAATQTEAALPQEAVTEAALPQETMREEGVPQEALTEKGVLAEETETVIRAAGEPAEKEVTGQSHAESGNRVEENGRITAEAGNARTMAGDILPEMAEREKLADVLQRAGLSADGVSRLILGTMGVSELAELLQDMLSKGAFSRRTLRELMGTDGLRGLLQNRMEENLLLQAEKGFSKEDVSRLYDRIQEQTARLAQALSQAGVENSPAAKSVSQIRENIDFLNQLNQTYAYVQLPLKLSGQKAHGDLYVYSNKKNLARKDGTVSALLHLDMEHLGSLDIYVAMTQEKVSTQFYLEREELLDFMEQHISLLNERLSRKGYSVKSEVLLREKPVHVIEEIVKQEGNASVLSQYAFDVRA